VKEENPQKEIFSDMSCFSKQSMDHVYLMRCKPGIKEIQDRNNDLGSMF
jgi:hypothetical protein